MNLLDTGRPFSWKRTTLKRVGGSWMYTQPTLGKSEQLGGRNCVVNMVVESQNVHANSSDLWKTSVTDWRKSCRNFYLRSLARCFAEYRF
jgi:hypothetical protein